MLCRVFAASFLLIASAQASVVHVPEDYPYIQEAIDAATNGDTVLVARGTYTDPANKDLDFHGKDLVLAAPAGPKNTTIDCRWYGRGLNFHSGETEASVVSGFTIRYGVGSGGGIYCNGSSPTITQCVITDNSGEGPGGGLYCENASPRISNCIIRRNSVIGYYGGGIYCLDSSAPVISNCKISANSASDGGGMYCRGNSDPTITNCTISGNSATGYSGGGMHCESSSPKLTNCTFSDNSARQVGGAIASFYSSFPEFTNCILWGDSPEEVFGVGNPTFTYCDVQGGVPGKGNIDVYPRFRSYKGFDYLLRPGSRCIDSGAGENDGIDWGTIHPLYGDANTALPDRGAYGGPGAAGWLP